MIKTSGDAPSKGAGKPTGLARLWADYRTYRSTLAELRSLPARQLRDIGVSRRALKLTVREAVYGN